MARNNQNQAARERGCSASFPMIPLIVIILAQVGTSSDNAALGIAVQELVGALGATVADVQMANLAYSLVAGSCMIAGGMIGVVVGWRKTLRIGLALAILGEAVVVTATSMDVFTWGGRFLVGLGASFITPSVLGLIPALYEGHARATAFGFVAAASAVSALVPIPFGILLDAAGFRVTFGVIALYFLGVLISTRFLPKLPKPDAGMSIDGVGIGLAAGGLALLLLGIARVSTWGVFEPLPGCPFTVFGIAAHHSGHRRGLGGVGRARRVRAPSRESRQGCAAAACVHRHAAGARRLAGGGRALLLHGRAGHPHDAVLAAGGRVLSTANGLAVATVGRAHVAVRYAGS